MSQNITVLGAGNNPLSVRIVQVDNDGQALALHDTSTLQTVHEEDTLHSTSGRVMDTVKVESAEKVVLAEILPVTMGPTTVTVATPSQGSQISSHITSSSANPRSHLLPSQTQAQVADNQQTSTSEKSTSGILVNNEKLNGNSVTLVEVDANGDSVDTLWPLVDTATGTLYCTRCSYTTDKKQNWYKHRQTHLGSKRHRCPDCAYETGSASNMKRHRLQHGGNKTFKCTMCEVSFHQKTHLQRHVQKAHVERKYPCSAGCGFCGVSEEEVARHFERKHKELVMLEGPGGGVQVTKRRYMCPHCNFIDVDRKVVQQHIKFHGKRGRGGSSSGGSELKRFCTQCSFVTDCESKLKRHEMVHSRHKPFMCRLCPYKASQREHVVRHLRTKHQVLIPPKLLKQGPKQPKAKPVAVAVSMELESSPTDMENRLIKQPPGNSLTGHSVGVGGTFGDKLFACNFCTLTFSKLLNLYKHVHGQHEEHTSGLSPLSCVICDFCAGTHPALLAHMRRHTASEEAKMAATARAGAYPSPQQATTSTTISSPNTIRHKKMKTMHTPIATATTSNTKTVMLELGQGLDVPVIVDMPETNSTQIKVEEEMEEEEEVEEMEEDEHKSLLQETVQEDDEILFLGDLTAVSADDAEALQASISGTQVIQIEDKEMVGDMQELVAGDVIEINGETYKVEMNPSTVMTWDGQCETR